MLFFTLLEVKSGWNHSLASYHPGLKQYEVTINPDRLKNFGITMNNANTGGASIEKKPSGQFYPWRGVGTYLENTTQNGSPGLICDSAEKVGYGNQVPYGACIQDDHESVGRQISMLKGKSPGDVVENVEAGIREIQKSLPEGLYIDTFLSRSELIGSTTGMVKKNRMKGSLLVIFVLVLLLGSFRGGYLAVKAFAENGIVRQLFPV